MKKSVLLLSLLLCLPLIVEAKIIQILHTNDLHSYFEGTRFGTGGYARLKTVLDNLRNEASTQGIETLTLDGGDFGEGSSYFFSNEGLDSFRALDLLGIDVTVLGNHDYMQGSLTLAHQIRASGVKSKILSANMRGKNRMGLKGLVHNDHIIEKDGLKIYIFGLTTAEAHFMYPIVWKGFIRPPLKFFPRLEKKAKKIQADFVIALTHIGLEKDIEMVAKSKNIDLVVGGHSHTRLDQIYYSQNKNKTSIPIVQTGAQGAAVGQMIIDLQPNHQTKIISYKLIDITDKITPDKEMSTMVEGAKIQREAYFARSWDEVIGSSKITLSGFGNNGHVNEKNTCWGAHLANVAQTVGQTDLGIHHATFEGEEIQAGPIRFGDLIDNYPHIRNFGDQGWQIVSSNMKGWVLKKILNFIKDKPDLLGLNITGLTWPTDVDQQQIPYDPNYVVNNILIRGEKIRNMRSYSMSYPSEIAYGLKKMLPGIANIFLPHLKYSQRYYWEVLETYIKDHSPLTCKLPPALKLASGKHH